MEDFTILVPSDGLRPEWLDSLENRLGDTALNNSQKNLAGKFSFFLDVEGGNEVLLESTLTPMAGSILLNVVNRIPLCLLANLTDGVFYFQALAQNAGGFLFTEDGQLGCADESRLRNLASDEILRMRALAQKLGLGPQAISEREEALREYFRL